MLKTRPKELKDPTQDLPMLIVSEDTKSSVFYFEGKIKSLQLNKAVTNVHIEGSKRGSAPISVVAYALKKKEENEIEAKRLGIPPFKNIYCVIDVDDHTTLEEAVQEIKQYPDLQAIISNETFELWYILHFEEYSTRSLHRKGKVISKEHRIDKLVMKHIKNQEDYNNDKDYEALKAEKEIFELLLKQKGDEKMAITHAKRLEQHHQEASPRIPVYQCNPSTAVYKLVEKLNEVAQSLFPKNPTDYYDIDAEYIRNENYSLKIDEFTSTMIAFINQIYATETTKYRLDLLIDIFENPENNAVLADRTNAEISVYFYEHYYTWKENNL